MALEIPEEEPCRFHNEDEACESHYKLGRTLGQGAFATVKLATELATQKTWAVKVIKRSALSQSDSEALKSELAIVQKLHHPNVVAVHEIYNGKVNCFIIMECCSGGEMFDRIISKEHYSEAEAVRAAVQMLQAINYCHEQGVVHRDLKPENLLYSSPAEDAELKLADFGLARSIKPSELLHNQCGTPGYVAPEVLLSTSDHGYDFECDLWSIGVIVFILLCGYPPFYDDDNDVLFHQICDANYEFGSPYWDEVSEDAKDLISKLLVADPKKRLTAQQALAHTWCSRDNHSRDHLTSCQKELKKYNARRRFRGAVRVVQMSNLLKKLAATATATLTAATDSSSSGAEPPAAP